MRTFSEFASSAVARTTPKLFSGLRAFAGVPTRVGHPTLSESFGRLGSLEVRLARSAAEVRQAQKLRYQVFFQEGSALPSGARMVTRRDFDSYDTYCDHLLVVDHAAGAAVVGTYRLLRQSIAIHQSGFYSGREFDVAPLLARNPQCQFLELGRSCVLSSYRNKRTAELLWFGIRAYVQQNECDVLMGCASFDGTDPDELALPLSFLHHFARAPDRWQARAWPDRYVEMNRLTKQTIDAQRSVRQLPPLLKGYLRLGAYIGNGAVVDLEFGTTDVLVVLPWSSIQKRYFHHFELDRRATQAHV